MATETTTLPRRLLARRLVELREAAKLKSDEAAKLAEIGRQTLWRLENGRTSEVKKPIIRALCRVYQVGEDDVLGLLWLADESRKDGWWQSYSDAIRYADLFLSLEEAASRISSFQLTLLPGLAQTADYRRAMARNYRPALSAEEIERHIELLAKRQARLTDSSNPLTLEVWLSEAALRHRIGGASAMAAQTQHLYELSALPNVSIRVVPLTVEGYLGLETGSFVLLEFPRHLNPSLTQPPVVYIESYAGALYLDKPTEIESYQAALSAIEEVALDEPQSRALLQKIEQEYRA
ncbi:helix-turn-helix transcriptional regulator [Nocardia sp. NPDC005998]|uniref:helix-turn-helix domain-containing protein n=1 Tax=Nocardia sp. NPDC005998 TaxID=3156894 RepID=UPI0033AF62BC